MQARVKDDAPMKSVISCAGVVFYKQVWTRVPLDRESEAESNPYLEILSEPEAKADEPVVLDAIESTEVIKLDATPTRKRSSRSKA